MSRRCEYCDSLIDDAQAVCPYCGAPDRSAAGDAPDNPETIAELEQWYAARGLPPYETTRFFIGRNYTAPRAFGIYEENGQYIVYKNKDDGTRAVRYSGPDEAYAVRELLDKLKEEILHQKDLNSDKGEPDSKGLGAGRFVFLIFGIVAGIVSALEKRLPAVIITLLAPWVLYFMLKLIPGSDGVRRFIKKAYLFIVPVVLFVIALLPQSARYFSYNGNIYCEYNDSYYIYDGYGDYYSTGYFDLPEEIRDNGGEYRIDTDDPGWQNAYVFENSECYDSRYGSSSSSSSSSSDYDWDSSSDWDSGSTDWSSDW